MLDPRWRKVLRDVALHKARTLLVVLAIAIGLAGAGTILSTWALVRRATRDGYLASDPASATLRTDSIDAALLERVRALPGIRAAQARRTVVAAAQVQGGYRTAILYAMDAFTDVSIGRLAPEAGAWPPADGAVVIEQSSLDFSGLAVGQSVSLVLGGRDPVALPVTGVVRDVGLAPGWMEHVVYGFVTTGTLRRLGASASLTDLQVQVTDRDASQAQVRRLAYDVKAVVEASGRRVSTVDVPVPGEHVHAAQMDSLLYTQGAFGLLALVACAFLVVNLVAAMLTGQVREIGVMKTLGAQSGQVARMYLVLALGLGVLASVLAIPVALALGRQYAQLKAELLNFTIAGVGTPAWAIAVQALVGLLLPVAAAAFPVRRGCRITIASALRDVGIDHDGRATEGGLFGRVGGLSRPVLLSLRNAFRRRQRLVLTLLALSTGGAVYLGARNLRASVIGSLDLLFGSQRYDFSLRLAEPQPPARLEAAIAAVPGVTGVEAWSGAQAALLHDDATLGNGFPISAPPAGSRMMVPDVLAGRWIGPGDSSALVVNRTLRRHEPSLQPGARVTLVTAGREVEWTVVGEVESGPSPSAWTSREAVLRVTGALGVSSAVVAGSGGSLATQVDLIQRVRAALTQQGMPVTGSQLLAENRRVTEDHLLMVVDFLAVMGWVMIVVGGMGLASTMSLAVLERTREIGVLKAIGARHRSIATMIQVEGLVIAVLSWLVALPLSIPMSVLLGDAFGRVMIRVPVHWLPEPTGVVRWLVLVVAVSLVACALPALRATRVTIARALAYE